MNKKYRLITRSDFDGIVCSVLFKKLDMIDDIVFAHPKDMQDGKIFVTENDITANLPCVKGVHLCFDHHCSELVRIQAENNFILDASAPSTASVIYAYYKEQLSGFNSKLIEAVNKADSANYTIDEISEPSGWNLLNFLIDPRTGLKRFRDYKTPTYQMLMELIDNISEGMAIDDILKQDTITERIKIYLLHQQDFKEQLVRCSTQYDNVVVLDTRNEESIYAGNRFFLYTLYPDADISIHVIWGMEKLNTVFAVGKSVIKRSSDKNIGQILLGYGGGGHAAAGTCQVDNNLADQTLKELIEIFRSK